MPGDDFAKQIVVEQDKLRLTLADGREMTVPLSLYPSLQRATVEQRNDFRLFGAGAYVHWPQLDLDLLVQQLLYGQPESFPKPPRASRRSLKRPGGSTRAKHGKITRRIPGRRATKANP